MKFYLFRHAEKLSGSGSNPPLSSGGLAQAEKLRRLVQDGKLPQPEALWVSPKIRTHQTFAPLSQMLSVPLTEIPELIEKQSSESNKEFRARIQQVIQEIQGLQKNIFICTHMDWTEEAMTLIPSDTDISSSLYSYWAPAQYMGFEIENDLFHFIHFENV